MEEKLISVDEGMKEIFENISKIIENARNNVQKAVNTELVTMYWNVGKVIKENILQNEKAEYGKEVINNLAKNLTYKYGRGYSETNLFKMIKFYDKFDSENILETLSPKLTWSHFTELIKIEDELKREFYTTLAISDNWSVRTLKERMGTLLYERTVLSKKPDLTIKNDLDALKNENKMSTDLFFRDPYVLDFLNLTDTYNEKDLENAILAELGKFILEFGSDFAFMARQKRIQVGNKDYYIDLLFYHRKLKRLVVIELKLEEFKPEHKGQVELYLKWLEKYEKHQGEESPIGIVLCATKEDSEIELLELDKSNIHVGQYLTELPPKALFEEKLRKSIENAKVMLEQRK